MSISRPISRSTADSTTFSAPVITEQPVDAELLIGEDAVFTIDADGTEPIVYQWWELI